MLISLYLVSVFPNKPVCFWHSTQHAARTHGPHSPLSLDPLWKPGSVCSLTKVKPDPMPSEHVLFRCRGPHNCAELPSLTQEKGRDWPPSPLWPRKEVETGCHPAQLPQEQLSLLVALTDRQALPSWLVTPRQGLWPLLHCPSASSLHSWKGTIQKC